MMGRTDVEGDERWVEASAPRRSLIWAAGIVLVTGLVLSAGLGIAAHRGGAFCLAGHGHGSHHGDHAARVQFAVDWLMHRVDASDRQREQVQEIVAAAGQQVHELVQGHAELHDAFIEWLAQPTLDREELEGFRGSEMQRAEAISRELTQALADLAEVLTPEQRVALIDEIQRFHR